MRWYKQWYDDYWQEVDEDHIKDTTCMDPVDRHEHQINKVELSHMYCVAPQEVRAGHLSSAHVHRIPLISLLLFILPLLSSRVL